MKYTELAREEVALYGVEKASLTQLLSLVLNSNQTQMLFDLASCGVRRLSQMTKEELKQIDGVGDTVANKLMAIFGIASQLHQSNLNKGDAITSPEDAAKVFDYLKFEEAEHFVCAFLNTKNEILHRKTIFKGSLNASIVHPREIFKEALRVSAASFVCAHNHPSGNPKPSNEDLDVTRRLAECGKQMGIQLLDHVIIGDKSFVSIKEEYPYFFNE